MKYEFPHLSHIDEVRAVIDDVEGFIVAEREWGTVINYVQMGNQTFPEVNSREDAIRRECRGLIFALNGKLVSRPFHKFFNAGERTETLLENIDLSQPHVILEKLDGCLSGDTIVTTPYGNITMNDICLSENDIPVLGYDHSINMNVWSYVHGKSVKDSVNNWYRITLDDDSLLELTENHKVWCKNKNRYLTILDLEEGDEVQMIKG